MGNALWMASACALRAAQAAAFALAIGMSFGCAASGHTPRSAAIATVASTPTNAAAEMASAEQAEPPTQAPATTATAAQLFNITPRPRTPSPTPAIVPAGVARTVPAGPTAPRGGTLSVALSLSQQLCSGGSVTVYATITTADGRSVRGATLTGTVALKDGSRDLRFAPSDAAGGSSATIDLGRPRGGYFLVWTVQAQAGGAGGAGSTYCRTPA